MEISTLSATLPRDWHQAVRALLPEAHLPDAVSTEDGPFSPACLAGNSDISITKRYIHPEDETVKAAMERATVEHGSPDNSPYSAVQQENAPTATSAAIN